jgi:hypothetical protein
MIYFYSSYNAKKQTIDSGLIEFQPHRVNLNFLLTVREKLAEYQESKAEDVVLISFIPQPHLEPDHA